MAQRYKVAVKVVRQEGTCAQEHKVGDQWVLDKTTPAGLCLSAFHTMYPNLRVLMFGGSFPWGSDPDSCKVACPDEANPVVFELRRLKE